MVSQWMGERKAWLLAHGIDGYPDDAGWKDEFARLPEKDRRMFQRMNARRLFDELDQCRGTCWLRSPPPREILRESIFHFDESRWRVGDFVIMPNHIHLLAVMTNGYELEDVLYSIKRFSARKINVALDRSGRLWQQESYDHIVRDQAELYRIRKYIADNPAKAGLKVGEYDLFSSEWLDAGVSGGFDPV